MKTGDLCTLLMRDREVGTSRSAGLEKIVYSSSCQLVSIKGLQNGMVRLWNMVLLFLSHLVEVGGRANPVEVLLYVTISLKALIVLAYATYGPPQWHDI